MNNCFYPADILLPDFSRTDGTRWSVIACDQFTSEPEYWQSARWLIGNAPSTLSLVLPEAWLDRTEQLVPRINSVMDEYLGSVLTEHKDSMIYVERTQSDGLVRRGIVGMIDLECYSYIKGEKPLIRATEGTVLERIPPRVAIRRGAPVELPHVMLLIDDPKKTVIEPLSGIPLAPAYDFDLMLGGGHIRGQFFDSGTVNRVSGALEALVTPDAIKKRYGTALDPLLFAVGDGNHSLAAAKASYEEIKAQLGDAALSHPARYALAEIVNLHDDALRFEPIYRVMFGVEPRAVVSALSEYCEKLNGSAVPQQIKYVSTDANGVITVKAPVQQLPVGTLQTFIDAYTAENAGVTVDYIHGEESTRKLASKNNAVGFLFDGMEKNQLFRTVMLDGALPRKTFSMGHARDKRYYLEARRIK